MAQKFKLQTVLKYRKTLEDQAQQRLAELQSLQARLQQQQTEIDSRFAAFTAQLQQKQQQGLSVLELRLYEEQFGHLRQQSDQLQRQLAELDAQLDQRRQELLVAARERKAIEKLKEKQLAEYLRRLDREERALLDEISLRQKGDPE